MPLFPQKFGRYLLVDRIASGGMAEIYRAKLIGVEGFEKTVVIKRIHPNWAQRRDFIVMLVDEAKILVHLNHPNIVQVFELGREGEDYFIAMEYVDGVDLRQWVQKIKDLRRLLPQSVVLRISIEALRGLHYAHERTLKTQGFLGIVHRDISPQNILLSFDGEVKVTDFGIAKALTQTHETQTGVLKGKYAYMSPEQASGTALDFRSDLFSCGVVLYELLFGERLFATGNDLQTLEKVRQVQISWPEEKLSGLFPGVEAVLRRALALSPAERFSSAEEFADVLELCLPPGEKIARRDLSAFMRAAFAEEVRQRRIHDLEVQNRTQSFLRQTKVTPPSAEDTVSLVETETELESSPLEAPPSAVSPSPALAEKRFRWMGTGLTVALLLAGGFIFFKDRTNHADPLPTVPTSVTGAPVLPIFTSSPSPVPQAMLPVPTPPAQSSSLWLQALPAQAQIQVTYPGGKGSGKGEVKLTALPLKTSAKVTVSLADYEAVSKTLEVDGLASDRPVIVQLKKKASGFGGIRVNAVPWGMVSISGVLSGRETPVERGRIPEGSYRVQVNNPSLKKAVATTAVVKEGRTTRCDVDFEGPASLRCR